METIKDTDFKEKVLKEERPVLLYFFSPLQVPCLLVEAPLENLEKEYEGRIVFYKMNINESVDTCLKYGVLSVPKMLIFKCSLLPLCRNRKKCRYPDTGSIAQVPCLRLSGRSLRSLRSTHLLK